MLIAPVNHRNARGKRRLLLLLLPLLLLVALDVVADVQYAVAS